MSKLSVSSNCESILDFAEIHQAEDCSGFFFAVAHRQEAPALFDHREAPAV